MRRHRPQPTLGQLSLKLRLPANGRSRRKPRNFQMTFTDLIEQLIRHEQLIDSNGFAHRNSRDLSLMWNPDLKIYVDYDFLLKCINQSERSRFRINPVILVDYVQTNQGIIGRSNYQQWAEELEWIIDRKQAYPCLNAMDIQILDRLKNEYLFRHYKINNIKAFALLN